jgi:hypothetical protein
LHRQLPILLKVALLQLSTLTQRTTSSYRTGALKFIRDWQCNQFPESRAIDTFFRSVRRDGIILGIRLRKCGPSQLVREDPSTLIKQDFSFPALQSRTIYLLARLPPALSAQYLVWDLVLSTRSRTLQIVLPPEFSINNVWPWSRFDVTDQVFFVSDNLDLDYAAAKISGVIDVYIDGNEFNSRIDFMLYSLRWAHNNRSEQPLYTIVPWSPSDSTLKDLNDNLDQYNYVTSMVHDDLVSYRVPISSSAEFRLAASEYSTTVDCSPSLVDDKTLCLVPFWKLELSWRVASTRQVICPKGIKKEIQSYTAPNDVSHSKRTTV